MQGSYPDRTGALIRKGRFTRNFFLSPWVPEEKPCENAVRIWPSVSQEESSHQKPNCPTPWSSTTNLQNCEKIKLCCLSHLVYGILLWQPTWLIQLYIVRSHHNFNLISLMANDVNIYSCAYLPSIQSL